MIKVNHLKNKLILTLLYVCILLLFWALKVPCLFKHFLEIPCPGCGMSGAIFAVMRFDIRQAFVCHPMFWSMPILYGYFLIDFKALKRKKLHKIILIIITIGFLVNWIARLC